MPRESKETEMGSALKPFPLEERGREKEWEGCISGCRKAPKLLARPIGFTCCLIDKVS